MGTEKCHLAAVYVTRFENHRSTESYDRALAVKLFIITSFCAYPIFIYCAWLKTRLFILPGYVYGTKHPNEKHPVKIFEFQRTCGPHPCIDELFISLTVCFLLKQVLPKIILFFISAIWPLRTYYNQGKSIIKKYPYWEREYRLKSITEDRITKFYNYLGSIFTVEKYNSLLPKGGPYFLYQPGFVPSPEYYEIKRYSYMVLVLFHYLGLIAILLVQHLIPPSPLDIEDSIKTEQNIKDAFLTQSQQ